MEPIILASSSPQRQEILKRLHIPFITIPSDANETFDDTLAPEKAVEQIALHKIETVLRLPLKIKTTWIIAADTLIFSQGVPMGKPSDRAEARLMLQSYSNTAHTVITALCCYDEHHRSISTRIKSSKVFFKSLSEHEIDWYLNTGEWQQVAGGYRIQGLAACFITKIEGSYSGIVGI